MYMLKNIVVPVTGSVAIIIVAIWVLLLIFRAWSRYELYRDIENGPYLVRKAEEILSVVPISYGEYHDLRESAYIIWDWLGNAIKVFPHPKAIYYRWKLDKWYNLQEFARIIELENILMGEPEWLIEEV